MKISLLSKLGKADAHPLLVIFVISIVVRSIPELIAYPYPIGYDVINYYLPVVTNFDDHWNAVSNQFPLYVSFLYILTIITNLDPLTVVRILTITFFGLFSVSIYTIFRRMIGIENIYSLFLSVFVMFQTSVLRTSWDLNKDILSLTTMFFAFTLIINNQSLSRRTFAIVLILCIISVLTDRMIGLLFASTLLVYALIRRNKRFTLLSVVVFLVLLSAFLQSANEIQSNVLILSRSVTMSNVYSPTNLATLFLIINIFLIPTGIIGFTRLSGSLLKIPLIITLIASLSWVVYPYSSSLLPDRWTFTFSILLSIFAGYGFLVLVKSKSIIYSVSKTIYSILILTIPFVVIGILFMVMSNDMPYTLMAPFHQYIGQFTPMTMLYNSISISESKSIVSAIEWINGNTPIGSNILINKHLRGWMELGLRDRYFQFYDENMTVIAGHEKNYYLIITNKDSMLVSNNTGVQFIYGNDDFQLYKVH